MGRVCRVEQEETPSSLKGICVSTLLYLMAGIKAMNIPGNGTLYHANTSLSCKRFDDIGAITTSDIEARWQP